MSFLLERLRNIILPQPSPPDQISAQDLRMLQQQQPQVILLQPEKLTDTYTVPNVEMDKLWGLLSGDCPLSALEEHEIVLLRSIIEMINFLETSLVPATLTPLNIALVRKERDELIAAYQREILAICRSARARRAITLRAAAPHLIVR